MSIGRADLFRETITRPACIRYGEFTPMAKKTTKKKVKTRAPRPAADPITGLSTQELQAEIARRQRGLAGLQRRRERLLEQIADIDAQIREMGGTLNGGTRKRPRNEMNLVEALQGVLRGTEMSVTEAAQAVQDAGYQTGAANFRTIVNQTLLREKAFKKVSRGVYTAS